MKKIGYTFWYQQNASAKTRVSIVVTKIQNPRRFASVRDWFIFLHEFVVCLRCKSIEKRLYHFWKIMTQILALRTTISYLIATVLLWIACPCSGFAQTHILGEWQIMEAKNTQGQSYFGTVSIQPLGLSAYLLNWKTSAGDYTGLGLMQGTQLCVGWGVQNVPFGVVIYKIESDKLIGAWTATGQDGRVGVEVATRVRAGIDSEQYIEGKYDVYGENPIANAAYEGIITITRNSDADMYDLAWNLGTTKYNGIGLRKGNYLYVGWGFNEAFGVIVYEMAQRSQAQGTWALPKTNTTGIENIRKK
jgi:hypothetical protein